MTWRTPSPEAAARRREARAAERTRSRDVLRGRLAELSAACRALGQDDIYGEMFAESERSDQ